MENYKDQVISDYLNQQHENAVNVYTQTPVTDEDVKNSLLITGRKAKLIRIKMENFEEDLAKVRSLQEGNCLTNNYRKCIEDMEKELRLERVSKSIKSFEIDKVKRFFDEIDE